MGYASYFEDIVDRQLDGIRYMGQAPYPIPEPDTVSERSIPRSILARLSQVAAEANRSAAERQIASALESILPEIKSRFERLRGVKLPTNMVITWDSDGRLSIRYNVNLTPIGTRQVCVIR